MGPLGKIFPNENERQRAYKRLRDLYEESLSDPTHSPLFYYLPLTSLFTL